MKRLDISQTSFELAVTYRWFSGMAFALLFFCLFWDGFLIFWYGIGFATGDMPSVFFLFPLIHVAVGVGLSYYTLCLFLNKSYIHADQRTLSVHHGPLPWPRGNKEIPVRELEQLYVQEKTGNKGSKYYILKALLTSGDDITVLGNFNAPAEILLRLERAIEDYLGIVDQPAIGEMKGVEKTSGTGVSSTRARKPGLSPGFSAQPGVELAAVGDFVTYEGRTFEVSHESLYEWNNGNTDRLLQLASPDNKQALLYIKQDKGLFSTHLEMRFSKAQQLALGFVSRPSSRSLTYDDVVYELDLQQVGMEFLSGKPEGLSIEQWIYRTAKGDEYIRILDHQGMETVFFGQEEIPAAFSVLKP